MKPFKLPIIIVLLALLGLAGWLVFGGRLSKGRLPNVVLISVDTCRADRVGCYGYPEATTPNIDALAREALLFFNTVSQVPLTLPSHCSMLTGTIPPYHGVHDNTGYRLSDSGVTLAEILREHGYRTTAVIGAAVLDSPTGLDQGFETYDDDLPAGFESTGQRPERRAEEVSRIAGAWLDEHASSPFFLFLHYFDPHDPYVPPEPFASRFGGNPYAGEIAYTDQCIGQVMEKLKGLGVYDSSIIIVVGDHGESLGEHGEPTHGYFIYHSATKVPLLIKLPGHTSARRIDEVVAVVDIFPTVLAQLGLTGPPDIQGQDLSPFIVGDTANREDRHIYSESMTATRYGCSSLLGVETGQWKYIQATVPELYDLTLDPGEAHNLADQQPEQARALQSRLRSILAEHYRDRQDETTLTLDAQSLARLQALGYVGGPVAESFDFESDGQDPKNFAEVYWKIQDFTFLANLRKYTDARRIAAEILSVKPDIADVHVRLARMAIEEGDIDAVITHQSETLRLQPDSRDAPYWHLNLGTALSRRSRPDEAMDHYREAIRLAHLRSESPDGASTDQSVPADMGSLLFAAYLSLGNALFARESYQEAANEYRKAVNINPNHAPAHYQLGAALSKLGRAEEAEVEYGEASRLNPRIRPPGD